MRITKTQAENAAARSAAANQARRHRPPVIVDWDEALARWHDILDQIYGAT